MSENTNIEWTDATWNFLAGCSLKSPGCTNCYAMFMAARLEAMALADIEAGRDPGGKRKYIGTTRKGARGAIWTGKVNFDETMLLAPLKRRRPTMYFVNSESDLFHETVPVTWIDQAFEVMEQCRRHTFQILTKRPARMASYCGWRWGKREDGPGYRIPSRNVWLGTSIENRAELHRLESLRAAPAAIRFLSLEPLLESLGTIDLTGIGWVIVGGESQPGARPMHPNWATEIRDQCVEAGVPFFFKQWGEWAPGDESDEQRLGVLKVQLASDHDSRVQFIGHDRQPTFRMGKKASGRLLGGREWNEMPATA
jgi:protein gp37